MTLLLDKLDWKFDNINNHWIYFYCLGIYTKKNVKSEFESDELLESKKEAKDNYTYLVNETKFEDFANNFENYLKDKEFRMKMNKNKNQ